MSFTLTSRDERYGGVGNASDRELAVADDGEDIVSALCLLRYVAHCRCDDLRG